MRPASLIPTFSSGRTFPARWTGEPRDAVVPRRRGGDPMRVRLLTLLAAGATGLSVLVATPTEAAPAAGASAADDSGFILSTTQPGGPGQAPMFVGNGYLAGRQPFEGQGYAQVQLPGRDEPLPTQSQVHGFFAKAVPFTPPGLPQS